MFGKKKNEDDRYMLETDISSMRCCINNQILFLEGLRHKFSEISKISHKLSHNLYGCDLSVYKIGDKKITLNKVLDNLSTECFIEIRNLYDELQRIRICYER